MAGSWVRLACCIMDDNSARFPSAVDLTALGIGPEQPPYDWPGSPNKVETLWSPGLAQYKLVQLRKYVKNKGIWICPNPAPLYCSRYAYGYKCSWLPRTTDDFVDGDRGFHDEQGRGKTITEVESADLEGKTECGSRRLPPSKKIMWMCYAFGKAGKTKIDDGTWRPDVFPSYPHNGGSVFVYADGHANQRKMGQGWAPIGYTKLEIDRTAGGNY